MGSLVLELQKAASESGLPVADLLRKALVVARKLKVEDFAKWIELELEGYPNGEDLPDHRKVRGMCGFSKDGGGVSGVAFPTAALEAQFCYRHVGGTIAQIEVDAESIGGGKLAYNVKDSQHLKEVLGTEFAPMLHVTEGAVRGILDSVRTAVLKWALQLEADGILGEGMTFSDAEKEKAAATTYTVNIHTASGVQIQQGSNHSSQEQTLGPDVAELAELVEALRSIVADTNVPEAGRRTLAIDVGKIEVELKKAMPDQEIIGKALKSVRSVLEQAVGSLLAAGVLQKYPAMFGLPSL